MNPAEFHATNLLLHLVNSVLLFMLLRRMTGALVPGAAVALLFALHPLHVESVAGTALVARSSTEIDVQNRW